MQGVTVSQTFGFAWNRFGASWLTFVGIAILSGIVGVIPVVGSIADLFIFYPALVRAALLTVRQGRASFGEAFSPFGKLLEVGLFWFLLALIPMVLIFMGMEGVGSSTTMVFSEEGIEERHAEMNIFLIVLGGILLFLFHFFFWAGSYFILDEKKGIGGAYGASFSLFSQHAGKVIGFMLLAVVVVLLGMLACGVGLLIAAPVVQIAEAALYVGLAEGGLPESGKAPTQA